MSFGEKLTKLRKEKGMSQEDLASNLNVSRQAVSKWESNNSYPETEKIVAICNLFNCSMDELIGLKESPSKKEKKILKSFNKYFDLFIKGIKLFYSMTFKQKIKCLFEMVFYGVVLIILLLILDTIIIEIIRNLLSLLPDELLFILIQTIRGILLLIYLIFEIYVLVKLYKVRYLDYYEEYSNKKQKNQEKLVDDISKNSTLSIKEEKIIIRDPNNAFAPFNWLKKSLIYFIKFISLFFVLGLAILFVILIACTIFILYFVNSGLLILYLALGLLGALVGIYVIIEILIKFIFNMKQSAKRLFIMFIIAMLVVGISGGFFACELTMYKIVDNPTYKTLVYEEEFEMKNNLLINFLYHEQVEVIFEERDNIKVEFYGTNKNMSVIETLQSDITCKNTMGEKQEYYERYMYYNYHDYFNGSTFNDLIRNVLEVIKNKEIISEDDLFRIIPKVYISKDNYEKLLKHYKEYESSRNKYWCTYE